MCGLAGFFDTDLFYRSETKRPGGTGSDTSRYHIMLDAHMAQITFGHFPVSAEVGRAKGTGQNTAMTSHADIAIEMDNAIIFIAVQSTRGTSHNARRIAAMKTGQGKEGYPGMVMPALFMFAGYDSSKSDIGIVLILTGHNTGIAAAAARWVE